MSYENTLEIVRGLSERRTKAIRMFPEPPKKKEEPKPVLHPVRAGYSTESWAYRRWRERKAEALGIPLDQFESWRYEQRKAKREAKRNILSLGVNHPLPEAA